MGHLDQLSVAELLFRIGRLSNASPLPGGRRPQRYADYIFIMEDFVERRAAWIDSQFPAGPTMTRPERHRGRIRPRSHSTSPPDGTPTTRPTDRIRSNRSTVAPEVVLFPSGANAEILVPSSNQLIDACQGSSLPNPANCFMNPDYAPGQLGRKLDHWHGWEWATTRTPTTCPYIRTDVERTNE